MGPQLLSNVRTVIIVFLQNAIKIHHPIIQIAQDAVSFPFNIPQSLLFRPVKEVAGPHSKLRENIMTSLGLPQFLLREQR